MREIVNLYLEIVRGIPILVLLFYIAFVGAPQMVFLWNAVFARLIDAGVFPALNVREFDMTWRAIFALTIGYSAFLAEIFRAGIEAVPARPNESPGPLRLR